MKAKRMAPVLLVLMATLLTGCFGGGGGSIPVSRSEIDAFFALYAHRAEAKDLNALLSMYQVPVTFTFEEISLKIAADDRSALSDMLGPRIYLSDIADYVNDYELDVKTIVKSVSGSSSSAVAEVVLEIEAYDGLFTHPDKYEIKFTLQKSSGVWRIRAEHIVKAVYEDPIQDPIDPPPIR